MKIAFIVVLVLITSAVFAQSKSEAEIIQLSKEIFKWEVQGKIDSLADVFDEKFMVISSTGEIQKRDQYLATLRGGAFVHNSIEVEKTAVTVENNTATVAGKGKFTVTISGNRKILHLSYLEVYTKQGTVCKLLALHASTISN